MKRNRRCRVSFIVEDSVRRPGLVAEHGLSALIEWEKNAVLFDTGQSGLLLSNTDKMGIGLDAVSKVALSHGHYDHTGRLLHLLNQASGATVLAHPAIFDPKYTGEKDGSFREIGIPFSRREVEDSCSELHLEIGSQEIVPGIFLTGEIPRKTDFEEPQVSFFVDTGGEKTPDMLLDDQALIVDAPSGLFVVLGCAHAGVINTLQHIRQMFPRRPVACLAGGMHLLNASEERLMRTMVVLKRFDVRRIVAGHCTGWKACCFLFREFGDRFSPLAVGSVLGQEGA